MEKDEQRWNYDLIGDLFDEETGNAILQVLVSRLCLEDKRVLGNSLTGTFSIKSDYVIARKLLSKALVPRDSRCDIRHVLWTAKVSSRVHYFIWRVILNIISTALNLLSRGVPKIGSS